ncbi:hypothetical protein HK405_003589, partial [Cladochytrium tenue]
MSNAADDGLRTRQIELLSPANAATYYPEWKRIVLGRIAALTVPTEYTAMTTGNDFVLNVRMHVTHEIAVPERPAPDAPPATILVYRKAMTDYQSCENRAHNFILANVDKVYQVVFTEGEGTDSLKTRFDRLALQAGSGSEQRKSILQSKMQTLSQANLGLTTVEYARRVASMISELTQLDYPPAAAAQAVKDEIRKQQAHHFSLGLTEQARYWGIFESKGISNNFQEMYNYLVAEDSRMQEALNQTGAATATPKALFSTDKMGTGSSNVGSTIAPSESASNSGTSEIATLMAKMDAYMARQEAIQRQQNNPPKPVDPTAVHMKGLVASPALETQLRAALPSSAQFHLYRVQPNGTRATRIQLPSAQEASQLLAQ